MAASLSNCWACDKRLNPKRSNKYSFWCKGKCFDAYHARREEEARPLREWSAYMCGEGPLPEGMSDPDASVVSTSNKPIKNNLNKEKIKAEGRRCGQCGIRGHNSRTCPEKNGQVKKATIKKTRQNICGICGVLGHNARTCK